MKIGILSDTHGYLDPAILKLFSGVDYILHGGDVGDAFVKFELEQVAPTTVVLGNTDMGLPFRETEIVELATRKFLLHHIVAPNAPSDRLKARLVKERPNVVVFGHTHRKFAETLNGVFYFNPGYCGKPKPGVERSVAFLHCAAAGIRHEFVTL